MDKTKRILFFISEIKYSGAAKIATWLSNLLSENGFDITFLVHHDSLYREKLNPNIHYICIQTCVHNKVKHAFSVIRKTRYLIKHNNYDLIVSFLPTESMYIILANAGLKTPVIVAERSDPYLENSTLARIGRFFYRYASGVVFQTQGAQSYFNKHVQKNSIVIPNPAFVPVTPIVPYKKRENIISHVARLNLKQKRQDILIRAFANVVEKYPQMKLYIWGDGDDENVIKEFVKELKLSDNVIFKGRSENVMKDISTSKLFVLSSDYEGIPNAVIEALSMGIPVVSTDCSPGGVRGLITNGINGYIVNREDYIALAKRMMEIICNPELAEQMSKEAPSILIQYSERIVYEKWESYCLHFIKGEQL